MTIHDLFFDDSPIQMSSREPCCSIESCPQPCGIPVGRSIKHRERCWHLAFDARSQRIRGGRPERPHGIGDAQPAVDVHSILADAVEPPARGAEAHGGLCSDNLAQIEEPDGQKRFEARQIEQIYEGVNAVQSFVFYETTHEGL